MNRMITLMITSLLALSLIACGDLSTDTLQKSLQHRIPVSSKEHSTPPEQPEIQEATITETVLIDEAGVKITAKELDSDGLIGTELKLFIENNSGKDLTFQCRNTSVNGYMIEPMMSIDVVNGKKANDSLTLMQSDLDACNINTIADIEFSFHIFTTADWENYLDTPQIQLKTSVADTYEYSFDASGEVAYEGEEIKIVMKGLADDSSILGPEIVSYIENNSDKNITVQVRDVSINGFMVDAIFSSDIISGKHAIDTITFLSSELEKNEITKIESIELWFHIFDTDSWDTIIDTDSITINF